MKVVCAWCKCNLPDKDGPALLTSHTICNACAGEAVKDYNHPAGPYGARFWVLLIVLEFLLFVMVEKALHS